MADISSPLVSEVAAQNTAPPPDGMPEGQPAASVNNGVREVMGAVKREWNRANPTRATTGTAAAFAASYTSPPAAYADGQTFHVIPHAASAAGATFRVNALAPKAIARADGAPAVGGELLPGVPARLSYEAAGDRFRALDARPDGLAQIGASVRAFGAAGDGAADDTAAFEALRDFLNSLPRGGTAIIPEGSYRLARRFDLRPEKNQRWEFRQGAEVVNDVAGAGDWCWRATHPTIPIGQPWPGPGPAPRYNSRLTLVNARFRVPGARYRADPALQDTAGHFEYRYCSNLYIEGSLAADHYAGGQAVFLSGVWNSVLGPVTSLAPGRGVAFREVPERWSTTEGSTALTATGGLTAADVGRVFQVVRASDQTGEIVAVAAVASATSGTLAAPARLTVAGGKVVAAPPRVRMTAGSDILECDAPAFTLNDVRRRVVVPGAANSYWGNNPAVAAAPLAAFVRERISATQLRLWATAAHTTGWVPLMMDPGIEIASEGFGGETNDCILYAPTAEDYCGLGVAIGPAVNLRLVGGKIHTTWPETGWGANEAVHRTRVSTQSLLAWDQIGTSWHALSVDHCGATDRPNVEFVNPMGGCVLSGLQATVHAGQRPVDATGAGELRLPDGISVWNNPPQSVLDALAFSPALRLGGPVTTQRGARREADPWRRQVLNDAAFAGTSWLVGADSGGALRGDLRLRRTSGTSWQWLFGASRANGTFRDALGVSGDGVFVDAPFALGGDAVPPGAAGQLLGRDAATGQARPILAGTGLSLRVDGGTGQTFLDSTGTGSGHVAFAVRDEGAALGTAGTVDALDFTGAGVTATRAGNVVTVTVPGGGGGGVTDGDKGDVVVSGGGAVWTVDARAVTFAKLQAVQSARLLGRVAAGAGDAEELTAAQARTLLGLGGAATLNVGAGAGTVAAGDDARLSDARTPVAHTQAASTITDFAAAARAQAEAALVAGANVTLTASGSGATRQITIAAAGGGGGAQAAVQLRDEGANLGAAGTVDTLDFTGAGVTASRAGNVVTVNVPGGGGGATNLSYDAASREVRSDTGTDAVLPLFTGGAAGLVPASGGGTANFLRADGAFAAPPGGGTPTLSGPNLLLGRLSAGAGAAEEVRHPTVVTPGARLLPGGWQRGMWVPCINANVTCALANQRLEVWPILWTWNEPFDRFRFTVAVAHVGGSTNLEVALFDGAGARLAHWSIAGALGATGVQVSPALASPVNPGPCLLFLHVLPQFSGGTGAPTLAATGQPIAPAGALGLGLVAASRAVFNATLAAQTSIGASPAVPNTMTNSNLPLFGMDTA